jgi:hypothetical protein
MHSSAEVEFKLDYAMTVGNYQHIAEVIRRPILRVCYIRKDVRCAQG